MTSKYTPLANYLQNAGKSMSEITLTFEKIEEIINDKLPMSARTYVAWWSNEASGGTHVQSQAWLSAGWKVKHYNLTREIATFERIRP
jgi:hypothetical protein